MRTHRELPWLWRSLVSIACALPPSACVDAIVGEVDICEYEGKGYTLNEKFSAKDGCNDCTCTIDGEVECTERACEPVTGCDDKEGCQDAGGPDSDAGAPYSDAGAPYRDAGGPVCDSNPGCYDAGDVHTGFCQYNGTSYRSGESFRGIDGCSACWCSSGAVLCNEMVCYHPDGAVAPGTCEYGGTVYVPGARFPAGGDCNTCECADSGVVECTRAGCSDAGSGSGDAGGPADGYCLYEGNKYRVSESFARGDNCNKCTCVADGLIECSSLSCGPPSGCLIGNQLIPVGESVTCEDGCNTCSCQMDGKFSRTERACSALATIAKCDASAAALHIPAALVYLSGDSLAVSESRCVNGQANDFSICYDDLVSTMGNLTTVFAVAGSGTRACSGTERVYSLVPMRDDYEATFPERAGGKIVLRGTGDDLLYQFGM